MSGAASPELDTGSALRVMPFAPAYEDRVVELIVDIQRGEYGIDIDAERQPDLRRIPDVYQTGAGNFWLAVAGDRVVGTAALLDIGAAQAALRKMFVRREYRGPAAGAARLLLDALLAWAADHGVAEVYLGTTPFFHAAHRFYEKHGFAELPRTELPASFPIMEVDTKFYRRRIAEQA